jgi:hypothetical protein
MQFNPEVQNFEAEQFEYGEQESSGGALSEAEAVQLASELLEISNEAELDRFLGDLMARVGQAAGQFIRSPMAQAVGGVLKGAAAKALPLAGGAVGGYFGGPLGAQIGSGLASAAGSALGLEAESMSNEDREFEGAKQFIRFAADTVKNAAAAPPSADPRMVAQSAAVAAARQHAPVLLSPSNFGSPSGQQPGSESAAGMPAQPRRKDRGHWIRRGDQLILFGA